MFHWKEIPQSLIIKKLPFYLEGSEGSILLPLFHHVYIFIKKKNVMQTLLINFIFRLTTVLE